MVDDIVIGWGWIFWGEGWFGEYVFDGIDVFCFFGSGESMFLGMLVRIKRKEKYFGWELLFFVDDGCGRSGCVCG